VRRGEPLYRVHAGFASNLRFALSWAAQGNGYTIGEHAAEQTVAEF
jgi:ribose 1,5-bisphosphokinase PhnN